MQNLHKIYEFFKKQDLMELVDLVGSAETKEENDFYAMVVNFFCNRGRKNLLTENL